MPKPPEKRPDRHYSFRTTNVVFAWSALALLVVTVWMVFADYAKPWKRLQAQFRNLETQSVEEEAQAERQKLNQDEIAQVRSEIAEETTRLEGERQEIDRLENEFVALDKKVYAADAQVRATKSLLDTARFEFDEALQSGDEGRIDRRGTEVEELNAKWFEERKAVELLIETRDAVTADLEERRSGLSTAEDRLDALRTGLDNLEARLANLDKKLDYFVLNAPLTDFIEPDLKVEQVMLPGLYQNINFTNVERVDRCVTCHVAANRVGFDDEQWEEPFRSHPRLDLFVGPGSPHPYTEYGCSACHGGLDRATDFARVGHSPHNEEQKAEWEKEWGWKSQKYLETPIYPAEYSEAGCVTCHAADVWTPGSQMQDVGRELITRMGCYGCHAIEYPAYQDLPRSGPSLNRIAAKTSEEWAYEWVSAPRDFHPTTWMPHFFFEENTQLPENTERQKAEAWAAVEYLWNNSETAEYPAPPPGNATRGQELFETVGCQGCHILDGEAKREDFFPVINRLNGPNLVRTGSKVDPGWLYEWIKDPKRYNPDTRMPNLRLTNQEAADITAYLSASRDPKFENLTLPEVDGEVRDALVAEYLQNQNTIEQSIALTAEMSETERNVYLGRETIQKYGCYGCHDIRGFEDAKPIGVELTEEGSKPLHQFDFGHVHDVPHTRHDWIKTKLMHPRIWDEGKEAVKTYGELYKMPNFGMSDQEAEAILTNVLGFTKESAVASKKAGTSPHTAALAEGRKLISYYNCQGCHLIEGKGHAISTAIEDPGLLPPNLASQGARTQTDWLFEFLHDPGTVTTRPWLSTKMPTFEFTDAQVNTLVDYFSAREERDAFLSPPDRPDRQSLVVGEVVFNMFQCAKCHPSGAQAADSTVVSAGELAPSLLLAQERLRHDWVPHWILDPQLFIPGTNMPQNFIKQEDGTFVSPLAGAIDAPMFSAQKSRMLSVFDSEEELNERLADPDYLATALRDHIWWGLDTSP